MERGQDEHDLEGASQGSPARVLDVEGGYDKNARVYFVVASDIPGLHLETPTFETLIEVVVDAATDLVRDRHGRTRINFKTAVDLMLPDGR